MRSLIMALIALMLTGLFAAHANARDHAVDGMLIGMAGGGMIGYMVGDEMDRDRYGRDQMDRDRYGRDQIDRDRYGRDHYRRGYRSAQVCRDTVVVTERHGHYREVVRTVCRDRDDWHRPHSRGYYRNTRYGHNDRW